MINELVYFIWLTELKDIGPVTQRELLRRLGSPENIYKSSIEELIKCKGIGLTRANCIFVSKDLDQANKIYECCKQMSTKILCLNDELYPESWRKIEGVPILFYYIGEFKKMVGANFICFNNKQLYNRSEREEIINSADKSIENHDVYVGILNEGIDNLIHTYLVNQNVYTLLLMANGPETCFPNRFKGLYQSVLKNGAILSIYPPFTKLNRFRLPKRNRDVGLMCSILCRCTTQLRVAP